LVPSPKRSVEPVSDIDTGVVDGLKVLDPRRGCRRVVPTLGWSKRACS
jgi:hypothetical protein